MKLQTKDHEKLLNVIDDLRAAGVSRHVHLPQIIVCGDQSSGKSSVLEAISGLKFPTKDALCTRFATELILRRSPEESFTASIVPDDNRSESEQLAISTAFNGEGDIEKDLDVLVERAGKAMGVDGSSKNFATDVLRLELSGPKQPHLTLVDLPGLFHAGSKTQSSADAVAVKELVTTYMAKPRSIILAVISAKNDFNNQIITKYAHEYDEHGNRTLGIITKPDTLPAGSDSEHHFVELAQNKDVNFGLGWHVLKNRNYEQRNHTNEERNISEKAFFGQGIWASLKRSDVGVHALCPRLSNVLRDQILTELPSLMEEVQNGAQICQGRLDVLGASRGTLQEQRLHLLSVSESFTTIIKEAVAGRYDSDYFGDPTTEAGYPKRIRAKTTNLQQKFADAARLKGHKYEIVDQVPSTESKATPIKVSRDKRLEQIKELVERNRGKELAVVPKEENITALFRDQSSPWTSLAKRYAQKIFDETKASVMLALGATCDPTTAEGVLSTIINPGLIKIKSHLDATVEKIMVQHVSGHPMTYNHYLTENLQKVRARRDEDRIAKILTEHLGSDPREHRGSGVFGGSPPLTVHNPKALLQALTKSSEPNMMMFACTEALDMMEAYYKVCSGDRRN